MKPGDLVKYNHPANRTLGLVMTTRSHKAFRQLGIGPVV